MDTNRKAPLRPIAFAQSVFPTVPELHGDAWRPPGQACAEALAEMLKALGCRVSRPYVKQRLLWEINVQFERRDLFLQLLAGPAGLLIAFIDPDQLRYFLGPHRLYREILDRLGRSLHEDPRFWAITWLTRADAAVEFGFSPIE